MALPRRNESNRSWTVAGALVLLASSLLTQYFYYIPKACFAAIIVMAVIAMIEVYLRKEKGLKRVKPLWSVCGKTKEVDDPIDTDVFYEYV